MTTWPDHRILDLLGIEVPIIQAPMAGAVTAPMAVAVARAGGLASLPCALLSPDRVREEVEAFRCDTSNPINLNFFCHASPAVDAARDRAWQQRLAPYYAELGLDPNRSVPGVAIDPCGAAQCALVEEIKPNVVSFHFGLPAEDLVDRVKAAGARVLSSATTVEEAVWLQEHGCYAIIAQGLEAGGHRGMFLSGDVAMQLGTMALVPQVADAVDLPVIAAGGIADARGIVAAFALGASAVQIGTAYLFCPEATISPTHRQALEAARDDQTAITSVFSGRPARVIVNRIVRDLGPLPEGVPAFPLAGAALAPLRAQAERSGSADFTPLWSGQAAHLCRPLPAGDLTRQLAEETLAKLEAGAADPV